MIDKFWKYFRWREWTFWGGLVIIVSGFLRLNNMEIPFGITSTIRPVIDVLYTGGNGGLLIVTGVSIISLNGKSQGKKV